MGEEKASRSHDRRLSKDDTRAERLEIFLSDRQLQQEDILAFTDDEGSAGDDDDDEENDNFATLSPTLYTTHREENVVVETTGVAGPSLSSIANIASPESSGNASLRQPSQEHMPTEKQDSEAHSSHAKGLAMESLDQQLRNSSAPTHKRDYGNDDLEDATSTPHPNDSNHYLESFAVQTTDVERERNNASSMMVHASTAPQMTAGAATAKSPSRGLLSRMFSSNSKAASSGGDVGTQKPPKTGKPPQKGKAKASPPVEPPPKATPAQSATPSGVPTATAVPLADVLPASRSSMTEHDVPAMQMSGDASVRRPSQGSMSSEKESIVAMPFEAYQVSESEGRLQQSEVESLDYRQLSIDEGHNGFAYMHDEDQDDEHAQAAIASPVQNDSSYHSESYVVGMPDAEYQSDAGANFRGTQENGNSHHSTGVSAAATPTDASAVAEPPAAAQVRGSGKLDPPLEDRQAGEAEEHEEWPEVEVEMDLPDQQQLDADDSHDGVASVHDEGSENNDGDVEVVITTPPSNHSSHHSESSVIEIPEDGYNLSTSMKSARTVVTPEADVSGFAPESYITSNNDTPMSVHRSVKGGTSSTKDGDGTFSPGTTSKTLITGGSTKSPEVTAASDRAPLPSIAMRSSDVASRTSGAAGAQIDSHDFRMMAKHAMTLSQHNRLGAGAKSAYQADMHDIGALGIGLQLYFMLTKYLGFAFLIMGLMSLPAIIVNLHGHGITDKTVDPLQLAYASLGNEGVSEEIVGDPKLCLPKGDIDCTWETVTTPFTSSPVRVSWIITFSDCVYSVFFLFFYLFYRYKAKQAIDVHLNENLTPAKYAVKVRGLPPDATEEEILRHFNDLYDLTKDEQYFPLWFGCCWARRRGVKHSQSKRAINRSVVKNLDHLAGTTSITKNLYLNTWIAEVSIAHPTGGLLRTFLSMEKLTESIARKTSLIATLQEEKSHSPSTFKPRDEKLLHASYKKLEKFTARLEKAKSSIKELKRAASQSRQSLSSEPLNNGHTTAGNNKQLARAKVSAAAKAARTAATNTQQAFNWDACECAFVVFNNLESRRRCLQDYRRSTFRLARKFQPKLLRFRNGTYPLIVTPAPEPSNILWENLEVTDRGRFYRRSLTNFVTLILLLISAMVISAAQSAQDQFVDKMPPMGFCDSSLPQVFYASSTYTDKGTKWKLAWDEDASCTPGENNETRYHIAYTNGIINVYNFTNPAPVIDPANPPQRCVDPCISEASDGECSTLPCFDKDLQEAGKKCETYLASHVLYCYCSDALAASITEFGFVEGPKALWRDYLPCRGYIKDFLTKNGFIVMAAAVVIIVNTLLEVMLRGFASFERHDSESSKASGIAVKLFLAQFLNTAIVVLLVNASLGLKGVPVLKELLKGSYVDFERNWYPTVGMGITTTMIINAFLPQAELFVRMFIILPVKRELKRRKIRTQDDMNKLYAGPAFDISSRYPMLLNSVFVTMVFCGGSPTLLFVAAFAATGTYWFDKLSITHLYSVKTTYDEELGKIALGFLPWTLVLHLGFSTWMYGNPDLMKSHLLDMEMVLKLLGLRSILDENPGATNEQLYDKFVEEASKIDLLGQHGVVVKVLRSNVMLIFLFFVSVILCILFSTIWIQVLWPLIRKMAQTTYRATCWPLFARASSDVTLTQDDVEAGGCRRQHESRTKAKKPVVIPEFTDLFRKSVGRKFRPDTKLGFERNEDGDLIRKWHETTTLDGIKRIKGQPMRTWEAMQAPNKTYAIEMNERYKLAVAEIVAAAKQLRVASMKLGVVAPIVDKEDVNPEMIEAAIAATDAVTTVNNSSS